MAAPRALQVYAGPVARAHLRERGLSPEDIRVVAGAAGGPKGLILLPLDEFLFGHWLPQGGHAVDLVGASIGAWRLAAACCRDPVTALRQLGHDYIHERYGSRNGRLPSASEVTQRFRLTLQRHFDSETTAALLAHPRWALHIATSAGRGPLRRPAPWMMAAGFAAAVGCNAIDRRGLGLLLQRCWFNRQGQPPDWMQDSLPTRAVPLDHRNFESALLASCSIPFWLEPVLDIPGAAPGAHWDGGLIDYHMHLSYSRLDKGLALIPHFQPRLVPGWLDKPLRHRHGATGSLDRAIVLCPSAEWIAGLPGAKIPDRSDFKRHLHDPQTREHLWRQALQASRALADEWAEWLQRDSIEALPLP